MRLRPASVALAAAGALLAVTSCSTDGRTLRPPSPDQTASILVTTTSGPAVDTTPATGPVLSLPWLDGEPIPILFSCRGQDVSPAVGWSSLPEGTTEVAIAMTDPDAGEFVHWVVTGLDPAVGQVPQSGVPEEAAQARNDFGTVGYRGPCPPTGTHTYFVTLYALGEPSGVIDGSDPREAIDRLTQLQLAGAIATGTFSPG